MPNMKVPKLGRAKRRNRVVGRVVLSGEHLYTQADWGPGSSPSPECLADYLALLEAWEQRGRQPRSKSRTPADPQTMGALVDAYEAHLASLRRYQIDGQESTTWRFLRPCFASWKEAWGKRPIRHFRKADLVAYRNSQERLVAEGRHLPRHANRRLARLREFIVWAIQSDHLPETLGWTADHLPKVQASLHQDVVAARTHPKRAVSWEDVEAVAAVCSDLYATLIRVHRTIGCRPGELVSMRGSEIDRSTPDWWKWSPTRHKTKRYGHSIVYWIPKAAQDLLESWFTQGLMFLGATGQPLTTEAYLSAVESACARAGVPRFTPHELRHAVATERANDPSIPLAAASRSIGHARMSSMQPYVHEDTEQIKRAATPRR